jgi:hypothetical protein
MSIVIPLPGWSLVFFELFCGTAVAEESRRQIAAQGSAELTVAAHIVFPRSMFILSL